MPLVLVLTIAAVTRLSRTAKSSVRTAAFAEYLALDGRGYAASGEDCLTPTAGLFVAGDCRSKTVHQLTTAVADGAVAALAACSWLNKNP